MKSIRVYDLPTRFFHWLFAALFIGAFFIAKTYDDDSAAYPYHMMMGLTLVFLIALRALWGVIGSRYARFASFPLKPGSLISYFKGLLSRASERAPGHNPASSWAALAMMGLVLGLGLTGYLMTSGNDAEFFEEVHELLANALLIVVLAHVAGVVFHTLKHRDAIGLSMVHGRKRGFDEADGIAKSHALAGFLFLALTVSYIFMLGQNYDPAGQTLRFLGTTLNLGEAEEGGEGAENIEGGETDEDDPGEKDDED